MTDDTCPKCDQRYVYASNMSLHSPVAPECGCTELDHGVEVMEPALSMCAEGYHLEAEDGLCFYCGGKMQ